MTRVLFITWDGPHQDYLRSLFVPIFAALAPAGYTFSVLQMSYASSDAVNANRAHCERHGIDYNHIPALRRLGPAGVGVTLAAASLWLRARGNAYDLFMPRSILPSAVAVSDPRARRRLVLDADGLSADERVDFGQWTGHGLSYRVYRDIEAEGVRSAISIITRTSEARDILIDRAGPHVTSERFHVVPNGVDEQRFRPRQGAEREDMREQLGLPRGRPIMTYVGSLAEHYLPGEMTRFALGLRDRAPGLFVVVLTGMPEAVPEAMKTGLGASIRVLRVPATEVPFWLSVSDLGLALRAATFSQRAVSPIKLGEYLLSGVPVLASVTSSDVERWLGPGQGDSVCFFRHGDSLDRALAWASDALGDPARRQRARSLGVSAFSLSQCVDRYRAALDQAKSQATEVPL